MSDDLALNQQAKDAIMKFKGANVNSTAIYDDSVSLAYPFDISSFFHRFTMTNIITPMDITLPPLDPLGEFGTSYYMCNFEGADGSSVDFYPDAGDSVNELAPGASFTVSNAGNVFLMFIFSYQKTWYVGFADQPISIQGGPGITVTGSYPNFTVSLATAQSFKYTYGSIAAQNYLLGTSSYELLTEDFSIVSELGTDWRLNPLDNSVLEFVGTHPKIYMMSVEIFQDSSTTNFRPQINITKQNVILNGMGHQVGSGGISAGQTTAIQSFSGGVFITAQPLDLYYFSVINSATGSPAAGVSTNFGFQLMLAEAR